MIDTKGENSGLWIKDGKKILLLDKEFNKVGEVKE